LKDNDSAFPARSRWDSSQESFDLENPGMTMTQYAAIQLKVPRSGDPDIDAMIRESRRADFAGQVLIGLTTLGGVVSQPDHGRYAKIACGMADVLIAELEKEAE
jgi:hypothetical protein